MRYPDMLPPKKDVARGLLLRGAVFVHLDPRVDGAVVPPWLRQQPQLVLQVGLDMPIPIPDLKIDDDGVYGTLSFNRAPFTCMVPWDAVFAVVGEDGRGLVWPHSMPAEIRAEVEREAGAAPPAPSAEHLGEAPAQDPGEAPTQDLREVPAQDQDPGEAPAEEALEAGSDDDAQVVHLTTRRSHAPRGGSRATDDPSGSPPPEAPVRPRSRARGRKAGRPLPPYLRVVK